MKVPKELENKTTVPLWPTTAQLIGIGRNAVYRAAATGQIPTLKIGGRIVVPVAKLLDLLGISDQAA